VKAEFAYLIEANLMRFTDSFAPDNEAKTVPLLIKKVKALRFQIDWQWKNFVNLEAHDVPLLKARILELVKSSESAEDLKVVKILVSFLEDRHLDSSYAQQIVTTFSRQLAQVNTGRDPKEKSANIKMAGFGALTKKLYASAPEATLAAVRENMFEWKMNYFHQLIVELRAPFKEYRNAVLWNLKNESEDLRRAEWFIKEDILSATDFNKLIIQGEYNRLNDFTPIARDQIARKLRDYCAKNSTVGGCTQFLRDLARLGKDRGLTNFQDPAVNSVLEELLQSLPDY
jgi:hypothetical protein